jgi:hypothetical protein
MISRDRAADELIFHEKSRIPPPAEPAARRLTQRQSRQTDRTTRVMGVF